MIDTVKVTGEWVFTWADAATGETIKTQTHKNLVTDTGLSAIAGVFVGAIPADSAVHLAMGTGTQSPSKNDTALNTEGFRRVVSTRRHQNNVIYLRFFILSGQAVGAWSELGVFLQSTEIPNSGLLLNRITPPGGINKAPNQALTAEVRIMLTAGSGV
ncbi:MAG: hypothetical protein WCY82_10775 [Desulfotomaculaceae bacterium]